MIDLNWIIRQENALTDSAKRELGDNYMLCIDLLELLQSIESFSISNKFCPFFEAQAVKGIFLAVLNTIRRHTVVAHILLRHSMESLVLFVYSMEFTEEKDYKIDKEDDEIIDFDVNLLHKANKHMQNKYPDISREIEGYKNIINSYYSHPNVSSAQYNIAEIDGNLKMLIFDNYFNPYIRETLLSINDVIFIILNTFQRLESDYKYFVLRNNFNKLLGDYSVRHYKHFTDTQKINEGKLYTSPIIEEIIDKLNKKYQDK